MTREEAIQTLIDMANALCLNPDTPQGIALKMSVKALEQETKTGPCKDCKYFEYDSWAKVNKIPIIVAHKICKKWGDGCQTKEDGYCFLFESQESEV